jgi:3-methylcrotonyl-CoA carboxylase alpha subunit
VTNERVRIDAGVAAHDKVATHYDALLAKIIVAGADREAALSELRSALAACRIEGVTTNLAALVALSCDARVRAGDVYTRLIDERGAALLPDIDVQTQRAVVLGALSLITAASESPCSPWTRGDSWALNGAGSALVRLQADAGVAHVVRCSRRDGRFVVDHDGSAVAVEELNVTARPDARAEVQARVDGAHLEWSALIEPDRVAVWLDGEWHRFERVSAVADAVATAADGTVRAPMPGVILAVRVQEGDLVARGQVLVVMEAMKMEHTLSAAAAGTVTELRTRIGERVRDGDALLKISTIAN